jgi:bacteriorhodopsin
MLWGLFALGTAAWLYIIFEIFAGEASKINAAQGTLASKKAFNALRLIVTLGWSIYPLGYVYGYIGGTEIDANGLVVLPQARAELLNIIYNLADFVNKIAFGVVIWAAATSEESTGKAV